MRIYVDFDDVLCETARALSVLAKEMFGRDVPYEDIRFFNLQKSFSLSDGEIARLMERAHEEDFLVNLEPTPGGADAVRALEVAAREDARPPSPPLEDTRPLSPPLEGTRPPSPPLEDARPLSAPLEGTRPPSPPLEDARPLSAPLEGERPREPEEPVGRVSPRPPPGHEVVIVTGRQPTCHAASVAWLRKHGLGHLEIIYVDKYGRPPPDNGSRGRSPSIPPMLNVEAFNTLHFDVAIDDSPDALDLLAPRTDCRIIIFDRPWNRAYPPTPSMSRAHSWADVLEQICRPKTSGT